MVRKEDVERIMRMLPGLEDRERGPTEPYPDQTSTLRESEALFPALAPFAAKGRFKLLSKYSQMKENYANAKDAAVSGYDGLPFGPNTRAAFRRAMHNRPEQAFNEKLVVSHEKKWANRWMRGVSR